jgi:hypothetical protein
VSDTSTNALPLVLLLGSGPNRDDESTDNVSFDDPPARAVKAASSCTGTRVTDVNQETTDDD